MFNAYTEWGELKEVVVGSLGKFTEIVPDESFYLAFQDNISNVIIESSIQLQETVINQREEDLELFAKALEAQGIIVYRPNPLTDVSEFQTPFFKDTPSPCINPRDQVIVIGDELIETSCQWRKRYFENDLMKPILMKKFREGGKWTCSPRPAMKKSSFDLTHLKGWGEEHLKDWQEDETQLEIMFDGAQCLKFGKDIVMNVRTKNHYLGYKWLKRHLEGRFNLHRVDLTDNHIDGMMIPIAPGKLLLNAGKMKEKVHLLPDFLKKWDFIHSPEVNKETPKGFPLASVNININVLALSPKKVVVFDEVNGENKLADLLDKHQFDILPLRLRHCRLFDGGAHCLTLDLNREDELQSF